MITINDILVHDYETPKGVFLAGFYNPVIEEFTVFEISKYKNDLLKFVNFIKVNSVKGLYFVGYNCLGFDGQVTQFILDNHQKWIDLPGKEVARIIHEFGSKVIEDQKYNIFPPYKEENFDFKLIDLPRIWHFFNEARKVSLKQLEYEMRSPSIETFDINPTKEDFTEKEIEDLCKYMKNDIINTYYHFKYTIGEVDHPLYKGKNKLNDREIIISEVGLPCLNWDDVKIGAEWNKKDYMSLSGKAEKELKPNKVEFPYGKRFKQFFPNTVKFQSEELKKFITEFGNSFVLNEIQEFEYIFHKDLIVRLGKGGIHSCEQPRFIKPNDDEVYLQCDIGSQYPNAIKKYGIYPRHLGIEWNNMLKGKIERRLHYKQLYKQTKDPKYNSLQEMGKLSLNGGAYGRLGTNGDWQQDPSALLKVTVGCQLEILMIVEALVLKEFDVVSANTDGFDVVLKKDRLKEFFDICSYYEEVIGNKEMGNIEYTCFNWIAQTSVNDYIASKAGVYEKGEFYPHKSKTENDHLKLKGDFEHRPELHKNSSFSVIPLALQNYYDKNISIESFIKSHNDIFDFCGRSNAGRSGTYYHEAYNKEGSYKLPSLIRYYVSKTGVFVKKMVNKNIRTNANDQNVQPADKLKTICNQLTPETFDIHLENVDREWYIDKAMEIVLKISTGKKRVNKTKVDPNQMKLF